MGSSRDFSDFEKGQIVALKAAGKSGSEISNLIGRSVCAINKYYKIYAENKENK